VRQTNQIIEMILQNCTSLQAKEEPAAHESDFQSLMVLSFSKAPDAIILSVG